MTFDISKCHTNVIRFHLKPFFDVSRTPPTLVFASVFICLSFGNYQFLPRKLLVSTVKTVSFIDDCYRGTNLYLNDYACFVAKMLSKIIQNLHFLTFI